MSNFEDVNKIVSAVEDVSQEREPDIITFRGVDGTIKRAVHLSLEGDVDKNLSESDEVSVLGKSGVFTLSFGEYLARLGLTHGRYFKATKTRPDDSPTHILKDLHIEVIAQRTRVAVKQHQRYTSEHARGDNLQQETAKDHGPFFNQTINDLGVEGLEAEEAPARVDYLDGIDEIISLDPRALETDGEEGEEVIKIGIQRSFKDKGHEVKGDPVRFIPEDPEAGPMFRVFILEDLEDYVDMAGDSSLRQKLLDIRAGKAREAGVDPVSYGKGKRNDGLPNVDKVLPGGISEQVARVRKVLIAIKSQLHDYIESANFVKQPLAVQSALRRQLEQIRIENFIRAVNELEPALV
jgi:hypothetical protein